MSSDVLLRLNPTRLAALIGLLLSSSCSGQTSKVVLNACGAIPIQSYSAPMGQQLAGEIKDAPTEAVWPAYVADYHRLRVAVRACATVKF